MRRWVSNCYRLCASERFGVMRRGEKSDIQKDLALDRFCKDSEQHGKLT